MFGWGKDTVEAVGDVVTGTIESIDYALSGDLPPDVRVKLEDIKLEMQKTEATINKGQVEINKIEAQSSNFFKSAWRPAIGWIGVVGLLYHFLVYPLLEWYILLEHKTMKLPTGEIVPMVAPSLNSEGLMALITAMLGIGGYRTYEKYKGITK